MSVEENLVRSTFISLFHNIEKQNLLRFVICAPLQPNTHTPTKILLRSMTCVVTYEFETSLQPSVIALYETHLPLCSNWRFSVTELILLRSDRSAQVNHVYCFYLSMVVLCARRVYKGSAKGNSGTDRIPVDATTCINKVQLNDAGR